MRKTQKIVAKDTKDDFLTKVGMLMEDDLFREFVDKHFQDWDDVVSAVMLIKAYQMLAKKFPDRNYSDNVQTLREYMKVSEFRGLLAQSMIDFMNGHRHQLKELS